MGACHDSTSAAATLIAATDLLKAINNVAVRAPHPDSVLPAIAGDTLSHSVQTDSVSPTIPDPLEFTVIDQAVLMAQLAK